MDYNKFQFYRANPYYKDGYIPPIARKNRTKQQNPGEIPQGDNYYDYFGRKHYEVGNQYSNIGNQGILESPEKFPFENRIALDKTYERNLNTIDIEGACSSSLMSTAVRNKWKARQSIIRREQELQQPLSVPKIQATQEEKRRTIALKQFRKKNPNQTTQNIHQFRQSVLKPETNEKYKNQETLIPAKKNEREEMTLDQEIERMQAVDNERYHTLPRHQSIDEVGLSSYRQKMVQNERYKYNNNFQSNKGEIQRQTQRQTYRKPQNFPPTQAQTNQINRQAFNESDAMKTIFNRRQARLKNPTYLSSDSLIFLAGKNLIK